MKNNKTKTKGQKLDGVNSRKKKSSISQVIGVESPFRRFRRFERGLARTFSIAKRNLFVS
jgi:hypothetical protein